jgi:hypothetical protein
LFGRQKERLTAVCGGGGGLGWWWSVENEKNDVGELIPTWAQKAIN